MTERITITAEECENVTLPGAQDLMFDWLHDQIAVRKRAAATIRSLQQPKVCEWNPKPDDRGAYSTACGVHVRDYKSITNFPKFCFNCGGKLTVRDGKPQEAVENDGPLSMETWPLNVWIRRMDCTPIYLVSAVEKEGVYQHRCSDIYRWDDLLREMEFTFDGKTFYRCTLAGLRAARKAKGEAR